MICSFTIRFRSLIWLVIFTFTLYSIPYFEYLLPYKFHLSLPEAEASESETDESQPPPAEEETPAAQTAGLGQVDYFQFSGVPSATFKVDDFTGAAHMTYPIAVPPGRSGLSPNLSLSYNSNGGNGWIGVGWDIPVGYIQRRGPRKGVPKYDDTKDVYELSLGGSLQELVCTANCPPGGGSPREYRLRIEGAFLKIVYYSDSQNYWEVWDKSGIKMRFGSSSASRIGTIKEPSAGTNTYRWCLDRVDDPKTNYMELIYFKDQDATNTYEIYLQEIKYNAQVSGGLPHNHRIIFNLEPDNRPDPIYNYRGGFKKLTVKRLSSIEVRTNDNLVRRYQLQYTAPNAKSVLSSITVYGSDGTTLPPTVFTYQAHSLGFEQQPTSWPNPSAWGVINGNYIRNTNSYGTYTDVIDMDGDGLPDRVVYDRTSPYTTWLVYFNNGSGFDAPTGPNWPNPSAWNSIGGNYIRNMDTTGTGTYTDVIDMDGDRLPDRVVYDRTSPYTTWTVYFNNRSGFGTTGPNWPNPSAWGLQSGNYIRNNGISAPYNYGAYTEVIDMNGDGLPDRVVYDRTSPYDTWTVYFNNGSGFDTPTGPNWPNPSAWSSTGGNYIRSTHYYDDGSGLKFRGFITDVIDMNGDGLPDRVVYDRITPYTTWTVYFNNGSGFDAAVDWPNPSAWDDMNGNLIRNIDESEGFSGVYADVIDMNGDGLPDRVVYDRTAPYTTWTVYFNNGSGFGPAMDWPNYSAWDPTRGNYISNVADGYGTYTDLIDLDGNGLTDRVVYDRSSPYTEWSVYFNNGPVPDLLAKVENGIGGSIEITYAPSTIYTNTFLPFVVQTVSSYTQKDGMVPEHSYRYYYDYYGGFYDSAEVEFRGFQKATAYQMANDTEHESKTETTFHQQDYYLKGKVLTQVLTSAEGHTRQVDNVWVAQNNGNGTKFLRLDETKSTITDIGAPSFNHASKYFYDPYFNVSTEKKGTYIGLDFTLDIETNFEYTTCTSQWILSKPTKITVKSGSNQIVSRKWTDYDCNTGNPTTEEVWKSDSPCPIGVDCTTRNSNNPVISYQYYTSDGTNNLWEITDPRDYTTTLNYEATKTHVYETINYLGHKTTTEYDLGTGNLKKLTPPHLQGTSYFIENTYDVFGRKDHEYRPDGGWTFYEYSLGDPLSDNQYVKKTEHIVGGPSVLDHETYTRFDGMGRTYWVGSSGPNQNWVITEAEFDSLGRVFWKSNPHFDTDPLPYPGTTFYYDGLSRVIDTQTPAGYYISTDYQGLKKIVTNQRGYSTAYTYDIYQRLKKVEENYDLATGASYSATEYAYDTLGNLFQVIAAKSGTGCPEPQGCPEKNTTTMSYDSLSKKRTMTDPDMGPWQYYYDKSGNLVLQVDAKNQAIALEYDGLNRMAHNHYCLAYTVNPPICTNIDHSIDFDYDDLSVPFSKGKLTSVSDTQNGNYDYVREYDEMQRVKWSEKTIPGRDPVIITKIYDSAGRVISTTYPGGHIYNYGYDVAGNLLYLKDNATQINVVSYSNFTALGQPRQANFSNSVGTTYDYYPDTGRLYTLQTVKPGNPAYQSLTYQYDPKGNIINLNDQKNGIIHTYGYDPLDRLDWAKGNNGSIYDHDYNYDRIGNIKSKTDAGVDYEYTISDRPHAVRKVWADTNHTVQRYGLDYDNNGNMTQRRDLTGAQGVKLDITYNYDNKPVTIEKRVGQILTTTVTFLYDGNGQRVKKDSSVSGITFYYGELCEVRNGVDVLHLFAGNRRVASVRLDGNTQFYHPNHLGSASFITDSNGDPKEQIEYHPFGTYRDVGSLTGTYDYDVNFPDVNYTFTDQEDDDDLGFYNYGARLYDPVLGRFISPDRIVQAPENPQSLNRYSYCLNNPLIYTDPSGEFIEFFIAAVLISAAVGAITTAIQGGSVGDILKGAVIGAVSAAVGFGLGYEIVGAALASGIGASGTTAAVVQGVVGGMMGGATASALSGGNVLQGMLIGGISGGITGFLGASVNIKDPFLGGLFKVGTSAAIGGAAAELTGGDFAQGAMLGAISGAIVFGFQEIKGLREYAQNKGDQAQAEQKLVALGVTMEKIDSAKNNPGEFVPIPDPGRETYSALLTDAYRSYQGIEDLRNFDLGHPNMAKFGLLHVRSEAEYLWLSYDRFDIGVRPISHIILDTLGDYARQLLGIR